MLHGMIEEVAGKYTQEQLEKFAAALTESEIQAIVDRYMGYANLYNDKLVRDKGNKDLAETWSKCCEDWTREATRWAELPAGLTD